MLKRKEKFAQDIYGYCDKNVGCEVLSIVFANFYPDTGKRNKTSLARHTSKIVNELVWEGILTEVKKDSHLDTPHGLYKILEHERLIDEPGFGNGKEGEVIKDPYNFDSTQD